MRSDKLVADIREATVAILWRQWSSLGGMTNTGSAQHTVDPEALLLASQQMTDLEPRLAEVADSWLWENSRLLSVQRVRNLATRFAMDREAMSRIADLATSAGDKRWRAFRQGNRALERPRVKVGHYRLSYGGNAMLQLRAGFGIGVRADVICFLLCSEDGDKGWCSTATIANALSYSALSVRIVADELSLADFVEPINQSPAGRGRGAKLYRITRGKWQSLVPSATRGWAHWSFNLQAAVGLHTRARNLAGNDSAEFVFKTYLSEWLSQFDRLFVPPRLDAARIPEDDGFWNAVGERASNWKNWALNGA